MDFNYKLNLNTDKEWSMQGHHFHENYEILLSLSEAGTCFVESKLYPLKRGTLLVLKDTVLHRTIADTCDHYERYVLHFSKEDLRAVSTNQTDLLAHFNSDNYCIQLDENEVSLLIWLFNKCLNLSPNIFGEDLKRNIVFIDILLKVSSLIKDNKYIDSIANTEFKRIAPVIEYIQNNLNEDLNLEFISNKFYMSKYHLCHIFKAATGFSVMQYIINSRILKARSLLRSGSSVQLAGEQSGFSNNSHFIRTFTKLSGVSPGRYRKEYQNGIRS